MKSACYHIRKIVILVAAGVLTYTFGLRVTEQLENTEYQTPQEVFSDIRRAWCTADVDKFMGYIGDVKTIVSFENEGIKSGLYSRNQAYYLLDTLFKKTETTDFTFINIVDDQEQDSKPYAVAYRTYSRLSDGIQKYEQIYMSLSKANHRWCITHIMSLEKSKHQHRNSDLKAGP
jgi:hypothetical protein